ncbi:RseA family anti-sigma factor [Chromatiaceae bacterium AAb-1]|nr:RseA family anti-sigma factor [Chromatiaceae bacterium AAb-1]
MSSENQDWLSAASDNQPITSAQLDTLLQDAELQGRLDRYQLIGAVLRREKASPLSGQFSGDFAALLEQEPEYHLRTDRGLLQKVMQGVSQAANGSWFKTVTQGTVAAGVALIAVFGVQQFQQPLEQDMMSPLPVLQTRPVAGFATPVSLSQTSVDSRFEQQQQQAMLEQQKRLQALLNAHRQQVRVMEQAQQAEANTGKTTTEQPERGQ